VGFISDQTFQESTSKKKSPWFCVLFPVQQEEEEVGERQCFPLLPTSQDPFMGCEKPQQQQQQQQEADKYCPVLSPISPWMQEEEEAWPLPSPISPLEDHSYSVLSPTSLVEGEEIKEQQQQQVVLLLDEEVEEEEEFCQDWDGAVLEEKVLNFMEL